MAVDKKLYIDLCWSRVSSGGNSLRSIEPFDYLHASSGKYVVDDSHFVPFSEAVKQLGCNSIGSDFNLEYDFENGKDTGVSMPLSRKKGVTLPELSDAVHNSENAMLDAVKAQQVYDSKIASFEDSIGTSKGSSGSDS